MVASDEAESFRKQAVGLCQRRYPIVLFILTQLVGLRAGKCGLAVRQLKNS